MCSAMLSCFAKGSRWRMALELFESLPPRGIRPNLVAYNALLEALSSATRWQRALALSLGLKGQVRSSWHLNRGKTLEQP